MLGQDGDMLSRNGYIYAKNNPLKYVDPSGEGERAAPAVEPEESWWDPLVIRVGDITNNIVSACGSICEAALDHPIITGAVIGVAAGAAIVGGVYVAGGEIVCGILCGPTAITVTPLAQTIANHAYKEHVEEYGTLIQNQNQYAQMVQEVMNNADQVFSNGQKTIYWSNRLGTMVIDNPANPTAFRPYDGYAYFLNEMAKMMK